MSAIPAIDIRYLRVDYGNFVAVDDLTLTVPRGEVFGLVGPNGAGKTSTFRVLTTLMEPTYGEVILDGVDVLEDIESARRIIGYMPDLAPVPTDLKVWEFLEFHAAAYGIGNRSQRRQRVAECLEEVALTSGRSGARSFHAGRRSASCSRKRCSIARACSSSMSPPAASIPSPAATCAPRCASWRRAARPSS